MTHPSTTSSAARRFPVFLQIAALAWALGLPTALLSRWAVDLPTLIAAALGAAVMPMVAGWVALWWTGGDRRGAVWTVGLFSAFIFLTSVWAEAKAGTLTGL